MAVGGIDDDEIDAGVDQRFAARVTGFADAGRGSDAQPALLVLAGVRVGHRLLDVLHGDQADAAIIAVDHQKLLDAMLVQKPLGFVLADAFAHGDQRVLGHQLGDFLPPVGGKAHVAIGEDADQLAGAAVAAALDHRDAGNAILLHQRQRVGERRVGMDGDRIDHHARFEFLDLPHLRRLHRRIEIAVNDADAAGLRHGDRHVRLGHRIHGRSDDRNIERDAAGDSGADIHLGRQHVRQTRLDQHVVEGQTFAGTFCEPLFLGHCQLRLRPHDCRGLVGAGTLKKPVGKRITASRAYRPARLSSTSKARFWVGGGS